MSFSRDDFNAADVELGMRRPAFHNHDGLDRLMVLEMRGVESEEACKGVTTLDYDLKEMATALYRAAYYDAVEKSAGTFTAETSHVKFVTDKLRKTHKATSTHWRLGLDVKLTVEAFSSLMSRAVRADEIGQLSTKMEHLVVFSDSPSQWACFNQEHLTTYVRGFDNPTFEDSYTEDECFVTMSDKEIVESTPDWCVYSPSEEDTLVRLLKACDGNISRLRQAHYDEFRPDFMDEITFEANLIGALKKFLMPAPASSAIVAYYFGDAAAGASIVSAAGPLFFTVPSPYCELAAMEHVSHQSLVDQCKAELSQQNGNHTTALAVIYRRRDQMMHKAMNMVKDEADKEESDKEEADKEEADKELEQLKERCRAKLTEYGPTKSLFVLGSCFLVALLGAMKVAVETSETVPLCEEEKLQADAASAGDKRKASEKDSKEGKEKEPSEAGPSSKKIKQ